MKKDQEYLPIDEYGLIGNMHTTALVSKCGSIDYLPFPRFDSPTLFAGILDSAKGGYFAISPKKKDANYKQIYLPDTAILLTRYLSDQGIAELTDFMPPAVENDSFTLVRKLKVIKGNYTFRIELVPGFGYGNEASAFEQKEGFLRILNKDDERMSLRLFSDFDLKTEGNKLMAEVELGTNEEVNVILTGEGEGQEEITRDHLVKYIEKYFEQTSGFWHNWIDTSKYSGRWQDIVNRSVITLKLLTSHKYGPPVAAATFGMPEHIGGSRNWDYRYSWIRDSSFTMYTFLQLGFNDEAGKFISWIQERVQDIDDASELKLMYRIDGSTDLDEKELSWLDGYKGSKPVRIGNGAFKQFQLDIYGELIDTIYIYNKNAQPISYQFWLHLVKFIDYVSENWKEKDRGIWEVRSDKREFLISKVMSWVALDRGILIAEDRSFPAPIERWRKERNAIFKDVFDNYWNPEKKAFVQYRGAKSLDASVLLLPLLRMLSPQEPRWISTLKAIEKELISDSLVYRYKSDGSSDGFPESEGTFTMCSFWYIECLAKIGEIDKAILHFEKVLGYANHLGLFSEQISMKGELLGNFPQAFTHLGLISAAIKLKLLIQQGSLLKQQDIKTLK